MSDNKRRLKIIIYTFICLILVLIQSILLFKFINNKMYELKQKAIYNDIVNNCYTLYENNIIKQNTTINQIYTCNKILEVLDDKTKIDTIIINNYEAVKYLELKNIINSYYTNNIFNEKTTIEEINNLTLKYNDLNIEYKNLIENDINVIKEEFEYIKLAKESVALVYDFEKNVAKDSINRDLYNNALNKVNNLKQQNLKNELLTYLNKVEKKVIEIEEINRKKIEEEKIWSEKVNKAWKILNVPYISQNHLAVYNGCELASLLMGLKFKGQLSNMDLITYSNNVPKTDDPNTGFYLSIFDKEPKTEAHWIAPIPLRDFGISSSGYNNIIDATGYSIDSIANEILNNNPVIIYLTYDFKNPVDYSKGVPRNLHVQLLSGYNTLTQEYLITDPWTRSNGKYEFILSKDKIEAIYNKVGKRAVIVR